MGFRQYDDGECKVCGHYTNKFCDACNRYICDEHAIKKPIENSSKSHFYCKECYEKGKPPTHDVMNGLHEDFHF